MINWKDIVEWSIGIVIALLGVSSFGIFVSKKYKKEDKSIKQSIKNSNNNYLAGGDIKINENNGE